MGAARPMVVNITRSRIRKNPLFAGRPSRFAWRFLKLLCQMRVKMTVARRLTNNAVWNSFLPLAFINAGPQMDPLMTMAANRIISLIPGHKPGALSGSPVGAASAAAAGASDSAAAPSLLSVA